MEEVLKRIGNEMVIDVPGGQVTPIEIKRLFVHVDAAFYYWDLAGSISPFQKVLVDYEVVADTPFSQIIDHLADRLDKSTMTKKEITIFCSRHQWWFRKDDCPNLFLIKKDDGRYGIVDVRASKLGLSVFLHEISYVQFYGEGCQHRLVLPVIS